MRRSTWRALTTLALVCTVFTPGARPLARGHPSATSAVAQPPGTEAGPELERGPRPRDADPEEAQYPRWRPTPAPVPESKTPFDRLRAGSLRATGVYTPSAISIEDLPREHPLIDLNLRFPPQDPDVVGRRIANTLREQRERREVVPQAMLAPSAEIEALAAGLDNDPRLIYEYVHNHFDLVPTWGLTKSPRETYLARAGNPFDQAALLVALLQAAGYEAEFVFGLIQIPVAQAMNWVGVTSLAALPYVFWNGGIPAGVEGDVLRLNHIWVRVQIDGTWHPLDPSFKAYSEIEGMDLATALGYDRSAFLAAAESGSTIESDYVQDINETNIEAHLTQYATHLIDHLKAEAPFAYLEDVVGGREIVPETLDDYPTALPYTVESSWGETAEMPEDYVYQLHIELPGIDYWTDLPDIAGERVTIFYAGATPADQAAIDAAGGIYNVYPAYQVNMVPELRVGGDLMATGDPLPLGSWEPITVTLVTSILDNEDNPWVMAYAPQWLTVGAWYALPMMVQTVSAEALQRHYTALEESLAAGLPDDAEPVLGQTLYAIGLSYFNQVDVSRRLDARIAGVVQVPHISGMLMSQRVAVAEWEWTGSEWRAKQLGLGGPVIDVRLNWNWLVSASGDAGQERAFMTASGHKGSAAEHATLEQLQDNPSVSSIQILDLANDQGLKIYRIVSSTVDAILPLLDHSSSIKDSLRRDAEAGYQVTVPEEEITYNDWTGTGWISFNPQSGSAGYWLSGSIGDAPGDYGRPPLRLGGNGTVPDEPDGDKARDKHGTGSGADKTKKDNPDPVNDRCGGEPIDTGTGNLLHATTDLVFGALGYPIDFARTYVSGRRYQDSPLGYGWTHSYHMTLAESSDWTRGFGYRAAMDAVGAIAESYVGVDIASTLAGALPHQRIVIGSEASDWLLEELTGNVVTVRGESGEPHQYLQLPDGSYRPCYELFSTLVENIDGSYSVDLEDGSSYNFDDQGRLESRVDAHGNQTSLTYDGGGNLIRVTDAVGRRIELSYDDGHVTRITDPISRTYGYAYDAEGNLASYTDAKGGITGYTYDDQHRLLTVTDPEGNLFTSNTYDAWNRVTGQANGSGATMTFHYGDVQTIAVDAMGYSATTSYDSYGRLAGLRDENGGTTSWVYDANDHVLSETDARGGVTAFTYDARGNVIEVSDRLGYTATLTYDAQNNLTSITDALSRTTYVAYDEHHAPIALTDGLGDRMSYEWDSRGQLVGLTDPKGQHTTIHYDAHGNPIGVIHPLGHEASYGYDLVGRLITITRPTGHAVHISYDANDAVVSVTDPLGHETHYDRDGNNLLRAVTDARGNATQFARNSQGSLTGITDALGRVTSYAWDANEYLIGITDARGHTTTYEVDGLGRVIGVTDPLGRKHTTVYDGNGNPVAVTKPDGSTIEYDYDAEDRLTRISYADGGVASYTYDAVGNMTGASYGPWHAKYDYDARDQLVTTTLPAADVSIAYAYDSAGNPESITARRTGASAYDVGYEYDAANRLVRILDRPTSQTIEYSYDENNNVTAVVYPGGAQTTYAYDARDRVVGVNNLDGAGALMSGWAYTYDEVDNLVQVARTAPGTSLTTSYAYDALDQLIQEAYPRHNVQYTYDAVGNRIQLVSPLGTVDYAYDAANQLLSAGAATFTYDANGNQTSKTDAHGTYTYTYDCEDRLTGITAPGAVRTTFAYDAHGRRIGAHGPGGETSFIYDGLSVILEGTQSPESDTIYFYGDDLSDLGGMLLAASRALEPDAASATLAHHDDGKGSIVNLSDGDGTPRAAYNYSAFGQAQAPAGGEQQPYRFQGQRRVRAEGAAPNLYLMGFRTYDASTGRFLTPDPLPGDATRPLSLNRYAYALNNPLRYVDPLGLKPNDETCLEKLRTRAWDRALDAADQILAPNRWRGGETKLNAAAARTIRDQAKNNYNRLVKQGTYNLNDADKEEMWFNWFLLQELDERLAKIKLAPEPAQPKTPSVRPRQVLPQAPSSVPSPMQTIKDELKDCVPTPGKAIAGGVLIGIAILMLCCTV